MTRNHCAVFRKTPKHSSRWRLFRAVGIVLLLLRSEVGVSPAFAVPPQDDPTAFRRIFVPADSPAEWPIGPGRYLSIDSEEFDQLVIQVKAKYESDGRLGPRIDHAIHRVALANGGMVLQGISELDVRLMQPHGGLLPLEPWGLPIASARWSRNRSQPAQIALWHPPDRTHVLGVWVEQSDMLRLEWELPAADTQTNRMEFLLETPPIAPQQLEVTLPSEYHVSIDEGKRSGSKMVADGMQQWIFRLAPRRMHRLQLSKPTIPLEGPRRTQVSQETAYRVEPKGLSLHSTFRLHSFLDSPGEFRVVLPATLKIVHASVDGNPAKWYVEHLEDRSQLVVKRTAAEGIQQIDVQGIAAPKLGQFWELPMLVVQGLFWTEGSASLSIAPSLTLKSLQPHQATLEEPEKLKTRANRHMSTKTYRFQQSSPDASIVLIASPRPPRLSARVANVVHLSAGETTARTRAEIRNTGRSVFSLEGVVPSGWSIESVSSASDIAVRHWHIFDKEDHRKLRIDFTHPIDSQHKLQLEINARSIGNTTSFPQPVGRLVPFFFSVDRIERELLLLNNRLAGEEESLLGIRGVALDFDELRSADQKLLPEAKGGLLLDLQSLRPDQMVELRHKRPQYDTEMAVEVSVLPESLVHRYELTCTPVTAGVSQITIELDDPLPVSAEWMLDEQAGPLVVESIESPSLAANDTAEQKFAYRIQLPSTETDVFRLSCIYELPAQRVHRCNAIRVPEATTAKGHLAIRGLPSAVQIVDAGWAPSGFALSSNSTTSTPEPILGSYRLGLHSSIRQNSSKRLTLIRASSGNSIPQLTSLLADYLTMQSADGVARYETCYYLESTGATEAILDLPPQAIFQEAWHNDTQIEADELLIGEGKCRFLLDAGQRWHAILVKYVVHGHALGQSTAVQANVPECSFPVGPGRWTLSTPEQYELEAKVAPRSTDDFDWRERLFGPLLRSPRTQRFHPLRGDDWKELWSAPIVGQQSRQTAEETARRLMASFNTPSEETWGDRLQKIANDLDTQEMFFVDHVALSSLGIESTTRFASVQDDQNSQSSKTSRIPTYTNQLPSRGLALIVGSTAIVLTSEQRVAHWRNDLRPTTTPGVYVIVSDSLATTAERLTNKYQSDVILAENWTEISPASRLLWNAPIHSLSTVSRNAWTVEFIGTPPAFVISRGQTRRAIWHIVWLASLAVGTWKLGARPERLLPILAMTLAICLVVPVGWVAIPQAVLIGLLSSAILCQILKQVPLSSSRSTRRVWPKTKVASNVVVAMLMACLIMIGPAASRAAEQPPDETTSNGLPGVLVPVDEAGEVQGDEIFVDESLLARLRSSRVHSVYGGVNYAIVEATYQGKLPQPSNDAKDSSPGFSSWTFSFDILSHTAACRVELPLRHDDVQWHPGFHRLDGHPVELTWNERGCSFTIDRVGRHRLELRGTPRFTKNSLRWETNIQVPPMPMANLELASGTGTRDLRVLGAGEIKNKENVARRVFRLAPNGRLNVSWNRAISETPPAWFDLLSWLRVTRDEAHLDVQLIPRRPSGSLPIIELDVAPHLSLRQLDTESPVEQLESLPGTVRLRAKKSAVLPDRLLLRFDVARSVSIGQIPYPLIRPKHSMADHSLFAVSVSSDLSYDETTSATIHNIAATEFAKAWGDDTELPLYAHSIGDQAPDWSLRVWPTPPVFTAQQHVQIRCKPRGAEVAFEALVDHVAGPMRLGRLRVPEALRIDRISIGDRSATNPANVYWSRTTDTEVFLLFDKPVQTSEVLSLDGWMDLEKDNSIELPKITLLGKKRHRVTTTIFRRNDVLVNLQDRDRALKLSDESQPVNHGREILVGHYLWSGGSEKELPRLRLKRNEPRIRADSLLTVDRRDADELAMLHVRFRVMQGVVSELQMTSPSDFKPPFRLKPAHVGTVTQRLRPNGSRELTVRLTQPAKNEQPVEFRMTGQIQPRSDRLLEVPNIRLLGEGRHRRFVLLPKRLGEESITWQRPTGLRRQRIPSSLLARVDSPGNSLHYRVDQKSFIAKQRSRIGPLQKAALRYAIGSAVIDGQGRFRATVELVVQPGRETHCTVQLPPEVRLRQLIVGDQRVRQKTARARSWSVPLGPPFMPRKVTVVYDVDFTSENNRLTPPMPEVFIGGQKLSVHTRMWRMRPVGGLRFGKVISGQRLSKDQFLQLRYKHTLQTIEDTYSVALDLPEMERQAWLRLWGNNLHASLPRVNRQKNGMSVDPDSEQGEGPANSPGAELALAATQGLPIEVYPARLPVRPSAAINDDTFYYRADSTLILSTYRPGQHHWWRWLVASAIALSSVLAVRRGEIAFHWYNCFSQWPHLLAMTTGFFWWALLQPSSIGLFLMALAACSWLRKPLSQFRQHRLRHRAS